MDGINANLMGVGLLTDSHCLPIKMRAMRNMCYIYPSICWPSAQIRDMFEKCFWIAFVYLCWLLCFMWKSYWPMPHMKSINFLFPILNVPPCCQQLRWEPLCFPLARLSDQLFWTFPEECLDRKFFIFGSTICFESSMNQFDFGSPHMVFMPVNVIFQNFEY